MEAFCQEKWTALQPEEINYLIHIDYYRLQVIIDAEGAMQNFKN